MFRLSYGMIAFLVFSVTLCVYLLMGFDHGISGDTIPSKVIPVSILEEGDLDLDEFKVGIYRDHQYCLTEIDRHYYSSYPVFVGITVLPVYAAAAILLPEAFVSWQSTYAIPGVDVDGHFIRMLEQYSAALIAALTVLVLWLLLNLLSQNIWLNLLLTIGVAFGTSLFSTASWALWQHGPSCLFLGITFWFFFQKNIPDNIAICLAGISAGWAVACRPTNLVVVVLFSIWVVLHYRKSSWIFITAFLAVILISFAINYSIYQHPLGGYSAQTSTLTSFDPIIMLKLLFNPSRGLFVYSPFLLYVLVFAPRQIRSQPTSFSAFCVYAACALTGLYACWGFWSGGHSFGPRLLTEAAFLLVIAMASFPIPRKRSPLIWNSLVVLVIISCQIHAVGTIKGDSGWNERFIKGHNIDVNALDLRNSQLAWTLVGPP